MVNFIIIFLDIFMIIFKKMIKYLLIHLSLIRKKSNVALEHED